MPVSKHEAGLGNASLWFFRQTQARVVRSEGAEVAAGPGHCWPCGGTCWCAGQCLCLPQLGPEELTPSQKAGRHPKCIICLYKWGPGSQGTQQPSDLHSWWKVLLWALLDAALTQFLGICSSEGVLQGFFSFLAHLGTGRTSEGRWEVELRCAGTGLVGSEVPPCSSSTDQGLGDPWGSPGPSVSPHVPPPWHSLAPALQRMGSSARPALLVLRAQPGLPPWAPMEAFLHCFFFVEPFIG